MISVLTKTKHLKKKKKVKLSSTIVCFKCKQCGEIDEEIAENYCANVNCSYKK